MANGFEEGKHPRWTLEARVIEEHCGTNRRDYFGYCEASIEEIQLIRDWTDHCLQGTYPLDDRGHFTLFMDFNRTASEWSRDFLIGSIYPGNYGRGGRPRNETLPDEGEAT